ncbi:MAG TPA: hypothetical protein PKJ55_03340 [Novosphingobium sp.]|jgi:uncharacterized membrane protein|nr:hypothetical protein [Novosphingobium sp.]
MTDAVPPTPPPSPTPPPPPSGGFDMNRPTIISLLYLSSFILGVTALIGVILAFVWKGEPHEDWEETHYQYLINTFWIGLVGTIVGIVTMIVLVGFLVLLATVALCVVRSVLSLLKAQKREPMPNPGTLFA